MKKSIILFSLVAALVIVRAAIGVADSSPAQPGDKIVDEVGKTLISNTKQLTFVGPRSGEGYFSADGSKMIYQSERDEGNPFYQMFVLDLVSGKSKRLSPGIGMTTCGWIHPSMKKAMWSSTHLDPKAKEKAQAEYAERAKPIKKRYSWSYDENFDIFESDLNGRQVRRLTKERGYDAEGSYSPNGKLIAFASNRSMFSPGEYNADEKRIIEKDSSYAMEIYIMNSDGTGVKRLTHSRGYDGGPFFSADGKKITWRRFSTDGSRAEIFTMNIDGTEQTQITRLDAMSWAPYFHPSGRYIVFTTSILGYSNFELFIVDAEGQSKPVRVTFEDGFDGLPTFSPDGKKISWTHRNEKGDSQIFLAEWNHEAALKLIEANRTKNLTELHLSPDINETDVQTLIKYLASEKFKGRSTGSLEEVEYTEKFASLFQKWGLVPLMGDSFFNNFEYVTEVVPGSKNSLHFKGKVEKELTIGKDYQLTSLTVSGDVPPTPVVFAGYGIKAPASDKFKAYDSYQDLDVSGKWVVIFRGIPAGITDKEYRQFLTPYTHIQVKVATAKARKAVGVIVLAEGSLKEIGYDGVFADQSSISVIKMSPQMFMEIAGVGGSQPNDFNTFLAKYDGPEAKAGFALPSQYLQAHVEITQRRSSGRNVVAVLNPTVPAKDAASLLIGAHGDHLGDGLKIGSSLARADERGKIHFGADDNASGVSGILELAHYYSQPHVRATLKRPVVFAVWSGEEAGILGSAEFLKSWEKSFKKKFKEGFEATLNMDMIGRFKNFVQVEGVGSAKEWSGLTEEVALVKGIPLSALKDPYLPTDTITFYLAETPSINFWTGQHEDYHSPRDTWDKINYPGVVKTLEVVKGFLDRLGTVKNAGIKYIKAEGDSGKKMEGRVFRTFLGTIPDYSQEGVKGVKISGTSKDSPGEKADLKAGDVIVEFDGINIENIYDYVYALQSAKPDIKIKLGVLRSGKKLYVEVTPTLKDK